MKRIPFTIEAWKAGGVPVTRSGEYVKQLTLFEGIEERYSCIFGVFKNRVYDWFIEGNAYPSGKEHDSDLFLEVPCTKYYTHYYLYVDGHISSITNRNRYHIFKSDNCTLIKTVEVEL